jgi:hypothetical protein
MLCSKLKRANSGLQTTKKAYLEHCDHVGEEKKRWYDEKEKRAQTERGEALRIYEVSTEDRQSWPSILCITHLYKFPVPTQTEILRRLSLKERDNGLVGQVAWLAKGFHIEVSQ